MRRLKLWTKGDLEGLMEEERTIQQQFTVQHASQPRASEQVARKFAKLMMEGKMRTALRLIAEDSNGGGPLHLECVAGHDNIREILLKKHPPKQFPK